MKPALRSLLGSALLAIACAGRQPVADVPTRVPSVLGDPPHPRAATVEGLTAPVGELGWEVLRFIALPSGRRSHRVTVWVELRATNRSSVAQTLWARPRALTVGGAVLRPADEDDARAPVSSAWSRPDAIAAHQSRVLWEAFEATRGADIAALRLSGFALGEGEIDLRLPRELVDPSPAPRRHRNRTTGSATAAARHEEEDPASREAREEERLAAREAREAAREAREEERREAREAREEERREAREAREAGEE